MSRSYTYLKLSKPVAGSAWRSIEDGKHWYSFHKDVWNRCRLMKVAQLEEFVSADTEYLLQAGVIEPDELDYDENQEEWFEPDLVLKTTEALESSIRKSDPEMIRSPLARFVRSLNQSLREAGERSVLVHLAWDPSALDQSGADQQT